MDDDPERPEATQQKAEDNSTMGQEESKVEETTASTVTIEEKLADEIRLRQYTERVLDTRQEELEAKEAERNALQSELDALKEQLSQTKTHLSEARGQAKIKEKQLSAAKDQIFRLQSTRKDITESEAVEGYRTLCGNVQRWVENRMKTILDDLDYGRLKTRPQTAQAARFVSFMREAAKRGIDLDQSDLYHVVAIIMNYLCLVFFSKSFYCPLDDYQGDGTLMFIEDLQASLSRLPRGKGGTCIPRELEIELMTLAIDAAHCREWRCETLTALTSQHAFKTRRTRLVNLVSEDLASLLSVVAPRASPSDLQSSLRRTIVEPAADLVHQLHLAPSVYSLKWPARGAWSRLEVYECLNLAAGGTTLDLTGTKPNSPARRNVSYLFDVAPGLFVERLDGGNKMPLKAICRPAVLVSGSEEGVAQKPTVLRWISDASNGHQGTGQESAARATNPRSRWSIIHNPTQHY
jgi:hypothetical protein